MSSGHVQEDYPLVGGYGETRSKWLWVGVIAFVCWNILLFSLAVAAIAKVNNIKEPVEPAPVQLTQAVAVEAASVIPVLSAVSLVPNGVRAGAGTTIYSKTSPPPPFGVGSQNLRVTRLTTTANLDIVIAVWTNNTGTFAVLGSLTLDKSTVNGWYTPLKMPFDFFYDVVALPNNHFIVSTDKAVYAGSINAAQMTITAIGSTPYPSTSWKDVRTTALGVSTFALTYDTGIVSVNSSRVFFGAVVGSVLFDIVNQTPNITFLSPFKSIPTTDTGFPVHDTFSLSENTFVIVYGSGPTGEQPRLTCTVTRFDPAAKTLTFQSTTSLSTITPQFHLSAVRLDSETGVVFVVDANNEYDLRGVLVHRNPNLIDGVHFGDVLTIEAGIADSIYTKVFVNGGVPFIDSAAISSNKIALAWADFSNSGALTAAIVTVDGARNLHSSPLYVLGQPLTLDQLFNYTVSVAGLSIPSNELYGAVVIDRKIAGDAASSGNVALIEVAPRAFGIASQSGLPGGKVSVTISGQLDLPASFPSPLKPGYLYYARTDGTLEAGPLAGTVDRAANYITLSDGSIVSADSAVAVGISPRQLYVLPSYH